MRVAELSDKLFDYANYGNKHIIPQNRDFVKGYRQLDLDCMRYSTETD